jgi:hypothetical protein
MKRGKDRPVTDAERAAVVVSRRKGLKLYAIAHDLGRHTSTISRIAVEAGVSKPRKLPIRDRRRGPPWQNICGILSLPC